MITWKELSVSPEEEALAREIIESGAGKKLPEEKLYEFQTGEEHSLEIETRAGKTHVNFYLPLGEKENLPLYINIHGGGFIKGMRDQDYVFCRNICSRAGVAVADIDYVPAPHMRYPGQVYACYDVLQYFAQNTAKWNLDREKLLWEVTQQAEIWQLQSFLWQSMKMLLYLHCKFWTIRDWSFTFQREKRETETAIHEFLPGKQIFIIKCMQILNLDRRSIAARGLHRISFWHKCRQH